ncbi:MAG: hypothetical protein M1821_006589 [Bathelium mastoideum]|nr:MAG: hypothetical protein M1821_006589 [Bathelium mastoideum]
MDDSALRVAIIGAGLSGLALALALHQQGINTSIYEARDAPLDIGGGLMLTPNGLKVLEKLGIYESLNTQGYNFDRIYFQDGDSGRILETIEYGGLERYGIRALRTYRRTVLKELLAKAHADGIPIHFGRKFIHIVSETEDDVTWEFTDGTTETASLLIGADGIHSTVRQYLAPAVEPTFGSMAAIVAAIPTAQLELPKADLDDLNNASNVHPLPGGIVVPKVGAFVMAPQTFNGDEIMITVQRAMSEATHGRWTDLDGDKEALKALFRQNADRFPPVVQNAVRDIPHANLKIWPFYHIPRLDRWTSAQAPGGCGRVAILGDSAHALPPSAGQGVNQAFEDAYTFALVLGRLFLNSSAQKPTNDQLQKALYSWQLFRQTRVDRVLELNRQMDLRRMPGAPNTDITAMNATFDWLFKIDFDAGVTECMKSADIIP